MTPSSSTAVSTATTSDDEDEQRREQGGDETSPMVIDPLDDLTESERLALLIRFGAAGSKGGICAAMSHGHSFQSSIFRLPAKCSGCQELVWGPFTRGCTCLTCSVTVHRSCTGVATMPRCPTKDVFDAFCRSELGLPSLPAAPTTTSAGAATGSTSPSAAGGSKDGAKSSREALSAEVGGGGEVLGESATAAGDLEEWAKVDGASGHSTSPAAAAAAAVPSPHQHQEHPPPSASCAVEDLRSSFSWSPLGLGDRKRPISEDASEGRELARAGGEAGDAGSSLLRATTALPERGQKASDTVPGTATTADLDVAASAAASSTARNNVGIRGVTKMSVAGGVVGAFFGGPVGAVVGLKLGAVLGAGRSVQQGLWQRIEKSRREAGAEGIGMPKDSGAAAAVPIAASVAEEEAAARNPRDIWARIAQQVEGEQQPAIWYVVWVIFGRRVSQRPLL